MAYVDLTIEICGMSGDGTISAGALLNRAVSGAGLSVMAFDSYPAEIRGFGRCTTRSRIGNHEMLTLSDHTDILVSLDDGQSLPSVPVLKENAVVLFDNRPTSYKTEDTSIAAHVKQGVKLFGVPFSDLASEATGTTRGRNVTALGALAATLGISPDFFSAVIKNKFASKGAEVLEANLKSFKAGFRYVLRAFEDRLPLILTGAQDSRGPEKVLLSGNTAVGRGALDAGLKLYFGYPITPATPIMEFLAKALPKKGGRLLQMEDEIASIGAVLGSFYAGKRAMTATSGPGFGLMTELISHGVMAEIPAVIVNAQRGGPSTGLPTKTEQSDLQAAVYGGPGDSARIVIAPTNVSECYTQTLMSFQIAEKYQTPVIILTDFFLCNRMENLPIPTPPEEYLADGNIYPDESMKCRYRRFENTESGVSPRALPGMEGYIFTTTGLEHSEEGLPDDGPENHMLMTEKRHRKLKAVLVELPEPEEFPAKGSLDVGVIAWGSTFGSALEAVQQARNRGLNVGAMKIRSIHPFHEVIIRAFMKRCCEILIPELNYGGQLANLIGYLHTKEVVRLNEVTGVPMSSTTILKKIETLV